MREKALRLLIIRTLGKNPIGRTGIILWGQARKSEYGYTLQEFDDMLSLLRLEGIINCTNKRWWLSDNSRINYAKVSNE